MSQNARLDKSRRLSLAERLCADRGAKLTGLRRKILEILINAKTPLKAYDIIELMRESGKRVTPATIYRVLEFLQAQGLAHRINSLNAYAPCVDPQSKHSLVMFVCSECNKAKEINDETLIAAIEAKLGEFGLSLRGGRVEIQGACKNCEGLP
ncbi:MAG: transcriptional repressor [Helicobacteraceae bacterium]|jgi:Fur family zinc uptake transcriptional regulator|nr:transcriptional repressor [Helicobacteraceae bacterium]